MTSVYIKNLSVIDVGHLKQKCRLTVWSIILKNMIYTCQVFVIGWKIVSQNECFISLLNYNFVHHAKNSIYMPVVPIEIAFKNWNNVCQKKYI